MTRKDAKNACRRAENIFKDLYAVFLLQFWCARIAWQDPVINWGLNKLALRVYNFCLYGWTVSSSSVSPSYLDDHLALKQAISPLQEEEFWKKLPNSSKSVEQKRGWINSAPPFVLLSFLICVLNRGVKISFSIRKGNRREKRKQGWCWWHILQK